MVLRLAVAGTNADVLTWLEDDLDAGNATELAAEAAHDSHDGVAALEADEHAAGVVAATTGSAAAPAGEGRDIFDGRVVADGFDDSVDEATQGVERDALVSGDGAEQTAVILLGKKAGGNDVVEVYGEADGAQRQQQRDKGVAKNGAEGALVEAVDEIEDPFTGDVKAAVALLGFRAQEDGAHHGGGGEGHHERDSDGDGKGDGELAK